MSQESSRSASLIHSQSPSLDAEVGEPSPKRRRMRGEAIDYNEQPSLPVLSQAAVPKSLNHTFNDISTYSVYSSSSEDDDDYAEEEGNNEEEEGNNEEQSGKNYERKEQQQKKDTDLENNTQPETFESAEDPMDDGRLHNAEEDALLIDDLDAYPSHKKHEAVAEETVASGLDYDYEDGFKWIPDPENADIDIPVLRTVPLSLRMDPKTGKCIFPDITKEKSLHCRSCLKLYTNEQFLDSYIGNDQPPAGFYYLLRLLGFRMTNKRLLFKIMLTVQNPEAMGLTKNLPKLEDFPDDTLQDFSYFDKSDCDNLLKDLTIALNNVLVGRIRLPNFSTLDQVIEKIGSAKKILVLTGAGISTSLGIPDFRSKNGLYEKVSNLNLDDAQDVFTLDVFLENPGIFYSIAHEILPPDGIFSTLHAFIKVLQDKGVLLRNYTQNIDNIESFVGVDDDKTIQCHGSFATATCVTCNYCIKGSDIYSYIRSNTIPLCPYCLEEKELIYPTEFGNGDFLEDNNVQVFEQDSNGHFINENPGQFFKLNEKLMLLREKNPKRVFKHYVEHNSKSFGVLKPDITFFGEGLPKKYNDSINRDCKECDLLLCIGTSLKVQPVSNIVNLIDPKIPQILINRDDVTTNEFDVKLLGLCDDVAGLIAQKLNWEIPHIKWSQELKKAEFDIDEVETGIYNVSVKKP